MKIQLWSKFTAGKGAAWLTMLFIILMALKLTASGTSIRIPLPIPAIAVLGVLGFGLGILSVIKNKDRSLLTLLSIPIGLLIIVWFAAEILF
jgi:hypothetical protein